MCYKVGDINHKKKKGKMRRIFLIDLINYGGLSSEAEKKRTPLLFGREKQGSLGTFPEERFASWDCSGTLLSTGFGYGLQSITLIGDRSPCQEAKQRPPVINHQHVNANCPSSKLPNQKSA